MNPEPDTPSAKPESAGADAPPKTPWRRFERAFGPILAGAVIDAIDFATQGIPGLLAGAVAAFWICSIYRLPMKYRILWAVAAGYYCAIPFTRFLPLATMIGAYVRFREPPPNPPAGG